MASIQTTIQLYDKVSAPIAHMLSALNNLCGAYENVGTAMANGFDTSRISAMRADVDAAIVDLNNVAGAIHNNTDEQEDFNHSVKNGASQADALFKKIGAAVAAYASIQTLKKAMDMSDELVSTTARLNMMNQAFNKINGTAMQTDDLVHAVYQAAQDARGSFGDMAAVVAKFGNNARDAFSSQQEVVDFANLIQKQMTIAGASTAEASNAMLQLSQALGSGVLRGDELNSIFEQAPNLIQSIADYLNVPIGKIRAMAQEGQLSADIVKAAIFAAADDINAQFRQMPMTWGQVWTRMQNTALIKLQPVLDKINELANDQKFQAMLSGLMDSLSQLAVVLLDIMEIAGAAASFVYDHWSIIEPVVMGVAAAMGVYLGYLAAVKAAEIASTVVKGVLVIAEYAHAAATGAEVAATTAATAAQLGLNTALLACPLTWIIALIIAVIVALYIVVAVINEVAGTTISATGIIMGYIAMLGAFVLNMIIFVWNMVAALVEFLVNVWKHPEYAIKAFIVNVVNAYLNFCLAIVHGNSAAIGVIVGAWYAFSQAVQNIVAAVVNFFADGIELLVNAWNQGVFAVQTVIYKIADAALKVAEGAASCMESAATAIGNAFVGGANAAITAINGIIGAINNIPGINIGKVGKLGSVNISGGANKIAGLRKNLSKPEAPESFSLDRMDIGSISDAYNAGNQVGQDFAAGFENKIAGLQSGMQDWLGEKPADYWEAPKLDYINLADAASAGYKFGEGLEDKVKDFASAPELPMSSIYDMQDTLDGIGNDLGDAAGNGGDTADNTARMADKLDVADEDLKYLRDIAERDAINRFTTAEIRVDFGGVTNNVSSDMDLDGVVAYIAEGVQEAMEMAAEGVHV